MQRREHLLKIGVSGIRGVVGEFLTPGLITSFAQAFATYIGPGRVVIGRDTRASGEMLTHAVACGLLASGCDVVDLGIAPTPTIQIYVAEMGAQGGLALTASHNPAEYNALKLFNHEGLFFNRYERTELVDIYHHAEFAQAANREIGRLATDFETAPQLHIGRILPHVDQAAIRERRFRVALDAVNGAGSVMTPAFLTERLGCELHAISIDPCQPFPRVAEPRPEHLGALAALVREKGCDIGFAQDPDGDRLAVVDEIGKVLDNDDMLALVVDAVLARTPGPVAVNLSTSSLIDDIAARHGVEVFRTPVGEANVVERMRSVNAAIGGEGTSGGLIFPGVHLCRDGYTGMAFFLDLLARTRRPLSELAAALPRYHRALIDLPLASGRLGTLMMGIESRYNGASVDRSDGIKLILDDGWLHLRPSNTEPLLRITAEARTPKRLAELRATVERMAG
jgi:phosphomannomutase